MFVCVGCVVIAFVDVVAVVIGFGQGLSSPSCCWWLTVVSVAVAVIVGVVVWLVSPGGK